MCNMLLNNILSTHLLEETYKEELRLEFFGNVTIQKNFHLIGGYSENS